MNSKVKNLLGALTVSTIMNANLTAETKSVFKYPEAKKENIVEDFHGTKVSDPYRWLEDPNSEKTKSWIDEQNKLTQEYLYSSDVKEKVKNRITELWNYPKYSVPYKEGDKYFFYKNDGLQNQSVLYMEDTLESDPTEVLDPNKWSADGTVALGSISFSKDGKYLAYGYSKSGSDKQDIKIKDTTTLKDLPETIKWCKFAGIAWKKDNSGFFYNRYPKEGEVAPEDMSNYVKIFFHKLGTDQSEDVLVYKDDSRKELGFYPLMTLDKEYLILDTYHGTAPENMLYYRKADSDGDFIKLIPYEDASYSYIYNEGDIFYIKTSYNSPKERIVAVDLKNPARENWKEIIPESEDVMSTVYVINNKFVVLYMHNAYHKLKMFDLKGNFLEEIKLPTLGTVEALDGKPDGNEMFIRFTSFTYPSQAFRYDFEKKELKEFRKSVIKFNPDDYETKQVFYPSKDGTKVSMFIAHKKGLKLDGTNPTWLYGYGGFDVSLTPTFSIPRVVWLENGGVFAIPNLRGGGEYGEEWHKAGMLEKKQNVFDDFISAGEWLIENKYTSKEKLAINGGSNGGLLVGACMVQRPDLFGAVVCSVPVLDMLRYHKFTVGRYWIPEYGNAESNSEHFKFMYAYSPLHNIKKGVKYPSLLITTADTDDRVVPSHALKFAATIQELNGSENPMLIRVETKAGHGAGKPTSKVIEEQSDIFAFLYKSLKVKL